MRSNSKSKSPYSSASSPNGRTSVKLDRLFKVEKQALSEKALSTPAGQQLALLYMLGLFDQPVPREVFDALIAPPAIPGLTDGMLAAEVRATQWNEAIARLRDQGLISPADGDAPGALDCHPLVREYFGQRLAQIDRTAFKAAHSRLYDHYRYAGLPQTFREPVAYARIGALSLRSRSNDQCRQAAGDDCCGAIRESCASVTLRTAKLGPSAQERQR